MLKKIEREIGINYTTIHPQIEMFISLYFFKNLLSVS